MLRRKIEEKLELWWKSNTALFVDGARQVGKTYILEDFSKRKVNNYIYINLVDRTNDIAQLIKNQDAKGFIFNLSTVIDKPLVKGDTIIFLDEIQQISIYMKENNIPRCSFDLIALMKFLVQDGSYRFILSGSLLGVNLGDVISWPTGYMTSYTMYPLDFEEFLWANGINKDVINTVKNNFNDQTAVDDYIHNKFLDLFDKYILVGGMPQAVSNYVNYNDFNMVQLAHQNIEQYNRRDITKYAPLEQKLYISKIYDLLPEELNKQNKRFTLSLLSGKNNHAIIENSFLWLTNAGIGIPTYCVDEPKAPLRIATNRRLLKLFHEDVGLLTYIYMDETLKTKILNKDTDINFGAIYENVAAQLLRCHGFENLFYLNEKKSGEVDFLIEYQGKVLPIEIKSGKNYKKHSAINNLLKDTNNNIETAYIFNNQSNVYVKDNKTYLPIYMIDFIKK